DTDGALGGDKEERAGRVEVSDLGDAGQAAEGDLGEVLGEGVDGDGGALGAGGRGGEKVAAAVPRDDFDGIADGDADEHTGVLEAGAGAGPLAGRVLAGARGGGVGGIAG